MNTEIYVENPKGKNYGLSLRLGGGFTMVELTKGIQGTWHTRLRRLPHNSHNLKILFNTRDFPSLSLYFQENK